MGALVVYWEKLICLDSDHVNLFAFTALNYFLKTKNGFFNDLDLVVDLMKFSKKTMGKTVTAKMIVREFERGSFKNKAMRYKPQSMMLYALAIGACSVMIYKLFYI